MAQERIETLLKSQALVRERYHAGLIEDAIDEFNSVIAPALAAVDPRVSRCAHRLSRSFIQMVNDDPEVRQYQQLTQEWK